MSSEQFLSPEMMSHQDPLPTDLNETNETLHQLTFITRYENIHCTLTDVLESYVIPSIGAVIVIFNVVVIYYMLRYRRCRQHNPIATVYMINMVIGDLFVGLVIILVKSTDYAFESRQHEFSYDKYMLFRDCIIRLSLFISVLNLIPLTLDRVWAVKYPISHRQSKKTIAIKICIAVWFLAILFIAIMYLFHFTRNLDHFALNRLIFPLATFPTTLVFIVCYIVIFRELRRSRQYRERSGSRSANMMHVTSQLSVESRSSSIISLGKFDEKRGEVKFVQLAVKTVVIFILCWFPIATCGMANCNYKLESIFMILGFANAAVTPLIYYTHLRQALGRRIRRLTSRRQPSAAPLALSKSVCTVIGRIDRQVEDTPTSVRKGNCSIIAASENNRLVVARSY
ncbi:somatostatin receptor type 1-like [Clytia hemisphaerica]|uniref:G-protein coupled receptors family 1 profile domain-containing protein n=1 Tax=Clytia hemisphaerica TaxID=252671 RepID=A0A7M5XG88_9CNID